MYHGLKLKIINSVGYSLQFLSCSSNLLTHLDFKFPVCDYVDLCVSVVSDGIIVDNTPPTVEDIMIHQLNMVDFGNESLLIRLLLCSYSTTHYHCCVHCTNIF